MMVYGNDDDYDLNDFFFDLNVIRSISDNYNYWLQFEAHH